MRTSCSLVLLVVLAGCASTRPNPATGAVVVTTLVPIEPTGVDTGIDLRRVDPELTRVVSAYAHQITELGSIREEDRAEGMRTSLRLLAAAIDRASESGDRRVPGAADARAAAQRVRATERAALIGPEGEAVFDPRAIALGIEEARTGLTALALGPYAGATQVPARMASLDASVEALRAPGIPSQAAMMAALERAALVLTAMHTAIARGEV